MSSQQRGSRNLTFSVNKSSEAINGTGPVSDNGTGIFLVDLNLFLKSLTQKRYLINVGCFKRFRYAIMYSKGQGRNRGRIRICYPRSRNMNREVADKLTCMITQETIYLKGFWSLVRLAKGNKYLYSQVTTKNHIYQYNFFYFLKVLFFAYLLCFFKRKKFVNLNQKRNYRWSGKKIISLLNFWEKCFLNSMRIKYFFPRHDSTTPFVHWLTFECWGKRG